MVVEPEHVSTFGAKSSPHNAKRPNIAVDAKQLIVLAMAISSAFLLTLLRSELLQLSLESLATFSAVFVVCAVLAVIVANNGDLWVPSSIYLVIFVLFHCGVIIVLGFNVLSTDMANMVGYWLYSSNIELAFILTLYGVTAYVIGASGVQLLRHRNAAQYQAEVEFTRTLDTQYMASAFVMIGSVLVVVAVAAWVLIALRAGGVGIFFGSYRAYLDSVESQWAPYIQLLMGIGLCFSALRVPSSLRFMQRISYFAFASFAVLALPLGLRGEVLIPLMAALAVRAREGERPSKLVTLAFGVLLLLAIAIIREVRQVGLVGFTSSAGNSTLNGNIFDAIAEMGSSLRPTVEVVNWVESGDKLLLGASYWAPIERAICALTPGLSCVAAYDDARLMNVVVFNRVGAIGFSPIAEAFYNFGEAGVWVVMMIIGAAMGTLDRIKARPVNDAIIGIVMIVLLYNVRNAFVPVPAHLLLGSLLVSLAVFVRYSIVPRIVHDHT